MFCLNLAEKQTEIRKSCELCLIVKFDCVTFANIYTAVDITEIVRVFVDKICRCILMIYLTYLRI